MEKVLKPCGLKVRRVRETKNLQKLIEDSRNFVAADDEYYLHNSTEFNEEVIEEANLKDSSTSNAVQLRTQFAF